mgnify:CR=1 FL=1
MNIIIWLINALFQMISLLVIVHVFLSYFLPPYHALRQTIARLVDPLLSPIRKVIPSAGMFDLSPLVLIILVQLVNRIIVGLLYSMVN